MKLVIFSVVAAAACAGLSRPNKKKQRSSSLQMHACSSISVAKRCVYVSKHIDEIDGESGSWQNRISNVHIAQTHTCKTYLETTFLSFFSFVRIRMYSEPEPSHSINLVETLLIKRRFIMDEYWIEERCVCVYCVCMLLDVCILRTRGKTLRLVAHMHV